MFKLLRLKFMQFWMTERNQRSSPYLNFASYSLMHLVDIDSKKRWAKIVGGQLIRSVLIYT
jgi:hypothetical protein